MASQGGQDQAQSHLEDKVPEKQGFFSKVKDNLNLTKHLGFVSDLDSPANQAALAEVREREEREGKTEVVPQAPLSERLKDGINSVAGTAAEVATGASGGVQPVSKESPERDEVATGASGGVEPVSKESPEQAESFTEEAPAGETLGHPEADLSGAGDKTQGVPDTTVSKEPEQHKHSWAHRSGQKEANPEQEKDGHSFSKWALHTAHKLGNVVASKDLSDDLLSKKATKK